MTPPRGYDYAPRLRPARIRKQDGTWSKELDDLLFVFRELNDWAARFIESVAGVRRDRGSVSPKQAAKIHEIWAEKVTPGQKET